MFCLHNKDALQRASNSMSMPACDMTNNKTLLFKLCMLALIRIVCFVCVTVKPLLQVMINTLLQWHIDWALCKDSFDESSTRWLYALLAQIGKPVALESSSQLCRLLRHCVKLRRQTTDTNSVDLLPIHMLTALAGGYFGQDAVLAACMQGTWL